METTIVCWDYSEYSRVYMCVIVWLRVSGLGFGELKV